MSGAEMSKITVNINGKDYPASEGETILEVINKFKIDKIPTLCHDERLKPYGSCFLCMVEVEGMNKLVPSCSSLASDGMKIYTDNDRIRSSRKTALELLLSNHYADCIAPCSNRCPAGVDVQGYVALIANGKYREAIQLIKDKNPLPLICGRICVRECEIACRRNQIDEPVAINSLKRYVSDIDIDDPWQPEVKLANNKKVAVIGGGPSGLSCAYFLTLEGYSVTIFEKLPQLGGMLRYGIPEYRLPKKILDQEIDWILNLGIEVKTNCALERDFVIDDLFDENFKAVYLAIGAQKAKKFGLPDEDSTEGVMWGINFLRDLTLNDQIKINGDVIVIGGGNTALDAARTALRCQAESVKIVYRRSINEMPAHPDEVEAARAEGIEFLFLTNPVKILKNEKKLEGIECIKMQLENDPSGDRPRPVPISGSEFVLPCDYMISAIGQDVEIADLKNTERLELNHKTIQVNPETLESNREGVFCGGDAVTGPLTAINAIAQGKNAARSIDHYIKSGNGNGKYQGFVSRKENFGTISKFEYADFTKFERNRMPELEIVERINNFNEVELGFSCAQSLNETQRCLECGCPEYDDCILRKYASDYNIDISKYIGEVKKYKIDSRHPYITLDPNKCINCGICVRTCSEILKVSAIDFVYRGFKTIVKPAMEKELLETNCIACGNCIDNCPTGAISEKIPFKVCGTLKKENHPSICSFCSIGCHLNFKVIDDDFYYVANTTQQIKDTHNHGYLCIRGRFGYRYLLDKQRLTYPVIQSNETKKNVDWPEAIDYSSDKIKKIIEKYGPDSVAVFASPKLSNEELYLLQKLARVGFKNNNISSFSHLLYGNDLHALDQAFGLTISTVTLDELQNADIIVLINSDLTEENLIMELKIKEAQKKGAQVILINSSEIKLSKFAQLWINSVKGTNTYLLNTVSNVLIKNGKIDANFICNNTNGFTEFRNMLANFKIEKASEITGVPVNQLQKFINKIEDLKSNIVFIYNIDSHREKSRNDLKAIGNFLLLTNRIGKHNNGLIILRDYMNSQGLLDMGVSTRYLPGYVKLHEKEIIRNISKFWNTNLNNIFKPVDLSKKMMNEDIKALLIFGEDPLVVNENYKYFNGLEFLLVQDMFETATTKEANIILPQNSIIEQDGTYTTCDRRIQKASQIVKSKTNIADWQLIAELGKNFSDGFKYKNTEEIFSEICKINRLYHNSKIGEHWGEKLFNGMFFIKNRKARFSIFNIDLTTIPPVKPEIITSENFYRSKIRL
jgi:formate dehydrogenase major subunit